MLASKIIARMLAIAVMAIAIVLFIQQAGGDANRNEDGEYIYGRTDLVVFYVAGGTITGATELEPYQVYDKSLMRPAVREKFKHGGTKYLYLPPTTVLFSPFSLVKLKKAARIWAVINAFIFVAAYYGSIRFLIRDKKIYRFRYSALLVLLGFTAPLISAANTGQVNIAVWLLLVIGIAGVLYKKPIWAGIALGIATTVKMFPIVFLVYFLLKKQWTAAIAMISTGIGMILLSLPWFGISGWTYFFQNTFWEVVSGEVAVARKSLSISGSLHSARNVGSFDFLGLPKDQLISLIDNVNSIITLIALIGLGYILWKYRNIKHKQYMLLEMLAMLMFILTFSSILRLQYLIWALPLILYFMGKPSTVLKHAGVHGLTKKWVTCGAVLVVILIIAAHNNLPAIVALPFLLFGIIKPLTLALIMLTGLLAWEMHLLSRAPAIRR